MGARVARERGAPPGRGFACDASHARVRDASRPVPKPRGEGKRRGAGGDQEQAKEGEGKESPSIGTDEQKQDGEKESLAGTSTEEAEESEKEE